MLPATTVRNGEPSFLLKGLVPSAKSDFPTCTPAIPNESIVDRILSVSFMAALPPDEQERVKAELREVIATSPELAGKSQVTFPYETLAVVCNKRMYTSGGEMH